VARIDAVADKGYYKGAEIQACEEAGIDAYVAQPQRGSAVSHGLFRKEEFRCDAGSDTYPCPGGQRFEPRYRWVVKGHALVNYCNPGACRTCPLKPRCTPYTHRRISRWAGEAVLDRMADRLAARPELLQVRRETVEHPFGSIKQMDEPRLFPKRKGVSTRSGVDSWVRRPIRGLRRSRPKGSVLRAGGWASC
jgi:hypothetical protein